MMGHTGTRYDAHINALEFSLAVSGDGRLIERFKTLLMERYPGITIYDRNEEAAMDFSDVEFPPWPEIANVDAVFIRSGPKESITLRNGNLHRYFNCVSKASQADEKQLSGLLLNIVNHVEEILCLPEPEPQISQGVELDISELPFFGEDFEQDPEEVAELEVETREEE
jgi:hypothetical protein